MTKEQLHTRVLEIEHAVAQSLANHNALLGQLAEAKHWLATMSKEPVVESVEEAAA